MTSNIGTSFLIVLLSGGLGAILRWVLQLLIDEVSKKLNNFSEFPWGVFVVNILGCFILGILFSNLRNLANIFLISSEMLRLCLFTGFLGSFTTFSTFELNTLEMLQNGKVIFALINVFLSIGVGLIAMWVGMKLVIN